MGGMGGGREGRGKGEWTLHVMGRFMTQRGSVSFATHLIHNKTCHLNLRADLSCNCHNEDIKR